MNNERLSFTNRLEELFLSILRNVILLILALSVIASIGLLISGVSDTSANAEKYKYEKFDSKQLVNDLKESLKDEAKSAPEKKKSSDKKQSPTPPDKLKIEIEKQVNLSKDFFKPKGYEGNPNYWTNLYNYFEENAKKYGTVYKEGEEGIMEYANGQTQVLQLVLQDKDLNSLFSKKFSAFVEQEEKDEFINEYFARIRDAYPKFHENQIKQSVEFEQEQNAEALLKKAGAAMKLYIAAGLFAAFLLVSLILVLVKIERNLRLVRINSEETEIVSHNTESTAQSNS